MTGYNKAKLIARGARKAVEEGVEAWRGRNKEPAEEPAGRTSGTACHSFVPGTGVLLADGSTKPIEDIKTEDEVKVTDPDTGKTTTRKVAGTIATEDDKTFVDLTVTNAGKPSAGLIATTTHPFWVQSQHAWVKAGDLKPGMTLRTPDGHTVTVKHTRHFTQRQRTHDLTVSGIHTYYVLAGQTPVLVHNAKCVNRAVS
ncbi:polymorphic toxin-type HINT domain-containing protein [Streptomyces sp. DSM 41534]